ncbi:IS3 family transposase [Aeromicrobium sp.]|uniref:IS3 family transposase n=1 Tax=Aeromicrobium sp. TaxID=1871063 RepID=UPI0025BAB880|nr:IS3 family transposase [Aeromicrobium sp.]
MGRDFTATGPNQLWVTDLTYVPTAGIQAWAGIAYAYVCFIIDACSRMIVGWRVAPHMRTTMVLDAIEMARWSRGTTLAGLRCHSDDGSQFIYPLRRTTRRDRCRPIDRDRGDLYDNALAETVNGYYKAELIRGPAREGRPWKTIEDVELGTLNWVHWHNHERLHSYLDDVPPAEFEQNLYATKRTDQPLVEIQSTPTSDRRGRSKLGSRLRPPDRCPWLLRNLHGLREVSLFKKANTR